MSALCLFALEVLFLRVLGLELERLVLLDLLLDDLLLSPSTGHSHSQRRNALAGMRETARTLPERPLSLRALISSNESV